MKIFVGPFFIVGATRQCESPVYIWDISNGMQKAFCEADCGMFSGWPSVSYDDAHDIIYMECQNVVYACDLSILRF